MKRRPHFLALGLICISLVHFNDLPADANLVRYVWSGQLLPTTADDPWQIGEHGQSFVLSVSLPSQALDLPDLNVQLAGFEVANATLNLEGQEVTFVGNGILDFTDYQTFADLLRFTGSFERLGHTVEFGTLAAIPVTSFSFSQYVEHPPIFASTTTVARAGCCGRPYASIVPPGTPFTVIAEPSALMLVTASGLLGAAGRRLRRPEHAP